MVLLLHTLLVTTSILFSAFRHGDIPHESVKIAIFKATAASNVVGRVVPLSSFKKLSWLVCCDECDKIHFFSQDSGVLKRCVWSSHLHVYEKAVLFNEMYNWYASINMNGTNLKADFLDADDAVAWKQFEKHRPVDD